MEYEISGGKLRYWIFLCCLVYKRIINAKHKETYHTICFEILHWFIAFSFTTHYGKE